MVLAAVDHQPHVAPSGIAPHLRALMADYAATGLPPAFLPKDVPMVEHGDDDASSEIPMMTKLLSLYGLKFHPFRPDVPHDALFTTPAVDSFLRRTELGIADGGFAMLTGDPGTGKSVALRLLADRPARSARSARRHARASSEPHHGFLSRARRRLRRSLGLP